MGIKYYFGYYESDLGLGIIGEFDSEKQQNKIMDMLKDYWKTGGGDDTLLDPLIVDKFYIIIDFMSKEFAVNKMVDRNSPVYVANIYDSLDKARAAFERDLKHTTNKHKRFIIKKLL